MASNLFETILDLSKASRPIRKADTPEPSHEDSRGCGRAVPELGCPIIGTAAHPPTSRR